MEGIKRRRAPRSDKELIELSPQIREWLQQVKSRRWIQATIGVDSRRLSALGIIPRPVKKVKGVDRKGKRFLALKAKLPEILKFAEDHSTRETVAYFKTNYRMLESLGVYPKHKTVAAKITAGGEPFQPEKLAEYLGDFSWLYGFLRQLVQQKKDVEGLKTQITTLNNEITGPKTQLFREQQSCSVERIHLLEKYIQVVIACFTEALNDLGLRKEIRLELRLPDLQHFKGVGPDGKRASFQPEHCYEIKIARVKRQK